MLFGTPARDGKIPRVHCIQRRGVSSLSTSRKSWCAQFNVHDPRRSGACRSLDLQSSDSERKNAAYAEIYAVGHLPKTFACVLSLTAPEGRKQVEVRAEERFLECLQNSSFIRFMLFSRFFFFVADSEDPPSSRRPAGFCARDCR